MTVQKFPSGRETPGPTEESSLLQPPDGPTSRLLSKLCSGQGPEVQWRLQASAAHHAAVLKSPCMISDVPRKLGRLNPGQAVSSAGETSRKHFLKIL